MSNIKISQLPYIGKTGYTATDIIPFVNYINPTGTTSETKIDDLKDYILENSFFLPLSGGTVTGDTIFQSGLTATTISATTYYNLPIVSDTYWTSGTTGTTSIKAINSTGLDSTGDRSVAWGNQTLALGDDSTSWGYLTTAGWKGFTASSVVAGLITISDSVDYSTEFTSGTVLLDSTQYTYNTVTFSFPNFTIQLNDTTVNTGTYVADFSNLNSPLATVTVGNGAHSAGDSTKSLGNYSHAEGSGTLASGYFSHSEGRLTIAIGYGSHSEGNSTIAIGNRSHSEGASTTASGTSSHAEGRLTTSSGSYSHAEGKETVAHGIYSHAEGNNTVASGYSSHAEGYQTNASGYSSHAEGQNTLASGDYSHAEGGATQAIGISSHAEGNTTQASGQYSHAEGQDTLTIGQYSHAEGNLTVSGWRAFTVTSVVSGLITISDNVDYSTEFTSGVVILDNTQYSYNTVTFSSPNFTIQLNDTTVNSGTYVTDFSNLNSPLATNILGTGAHATGNGTKALGNYSETGGDETTAFGYGSHAEGASTQATGDASHAEGANTKTIGDYSHAEGYSTIASVPYSHAEGNQTTADGQYSHTEGFGTQTIGANSHAEGNGTIATGINSHAEGYGGETVGNSSHSEGYITTSIGDYSHSEGYGTVSGWRAFVVTSVVGGLITISDNVDYTSQFTLGGGEVILDNNLYTYNTISYSSPNFTIQLDDVTVTTGSYVADYTNLNSGLATIVLGTGSHTEGNSNRSTGDYSHAEGQGTTSIGQSSHSEGFLTKSIGIASHSEGSGTTASGSYSHSEGIGTIASGNTSFIHSTNSVVGGDRSVVLGGQNITGSTDDTVYVPYLNLNYVPTLNNSNTEILSRNSSNGDVEYTPLSAFTGLDTYVTGYTYSPTTNTFTIEQNQGQPNISASFDSVSGLTVNGDLTVTGNTSMSSVTASTITIQNVTGTPSIPISLDSNGKIVSGSSTTSSGIIYITNQTTGLVTYYTTLELARDGSVSGDTIYVNTGTYVVTTTATNGLAKSGVNWYFQPGAIVNKASIGDIFNDTGFVSSCNVYGFGIFNKTTNTGKIYNAVTSLDLMFECFSESSTTDDIFLIGGVSKKVIINHYSSISSAGRVINGQGSTTELVVNFNSMTSTSSNVIGGGLNQIKMNLNGNLIRSTTSVAISDIWNYSQVISNVTNVYGVGYGFSLNNGNPTTLVINGNTTGVIASVGDIAMNGNCTNLNISSAAKFIGGIVGSITCSGGAITTSWVGYAGSFAISGGKTILNIPISTVGTDRMAFSLTGGKLIINGDYQEDYYSRSKVINGATAELIINGDFICTATSPAEVYGGFFNLNNGTLRLKGRIKTSLTSYNEPLILWTGGKIIIENGKLVNGMTTAPPIVASAGGLVMKVLGTTQTNFVDGTKSIFEARKQFYKYTISNVATTTLTINLGAIITETNTGVYNTKALLAQRMASLINSSYANSVVVATYTLPNDYFEIESLVAGTSYVTGSEVNLSIYKTILNSYLITDLTNGLITQNVNVE